MLLSYGTNQNFCPLIYISKKQRTFKYCVCTRNVYALKMIVSEANACQQHKTGMNKERRKGKERGRWSTEREHLIEIVIGRGREREREGWVRGWCHADSTDVALSQWDLPRSDRCTASQWDQTAPAGRHPALSSWKSMKITSQPIVCVLGSVCVWVCTWMLTFHMYASHNRWYDNLKLKKIPFMFNFLKFFCLFLFLLIRLHLENQLQYSYKVHIKRY